MRDLAHALPRYTAARIVAGNPYREEGRGLGFSIGGFHPFRINDWKKAVKKVDSNITRTLGINKIPIIGDLHKAVTGAVDRLDSSVNKDFQKTKKWAQDHRKQLQIAAAIAGAAVGGWYLYTAASGAGAAGAAGAAAGTEAGGGIATSAVLTAPTIEALPAVSAAIPTSLLAPATVGAGELAATAGTMAATAAGGSSIWSTIGGVLGTAAKEAAPLLALGKALGVVGVQQQPQTDAGGGVFYGGGGGFNGGGGGGGFLGPSDLGAGQDQTTQQASTGIPGWALIAGGGLLLYLMTE